MAAAAASGAPSWVYEFDTTKTITLVVNGHGSLTDRLLYSVYPNVELINQAATGCFSWSKDVDYLQSFLEKNRAMSGNDIMEMYKNKCKATLDKQYQDPESFKEEPERHRSYMKRGCERVKNPRYDQSISFVSQHDGIYILQNTVEYPTFRNIFTKTDSHYIPNIIASEAEQTLALKLKEYKTRDNFNGKFFLSDLLDVLNTFNYNHIYIILNVCRGMEEATKQSLLTQLNTLHPSITRQNTGDLIRFELEQVDLPEESVQIIRDNFLTAQAESRDKKEQLRRLSDMLSDAWDEGRKKSRKRRRKHVKSKRT